MTAARPGPPGSSAADVRVQPPEAGESWTVLRMIRWSAQYLEEKGVPSPRVDAEHLLADVLGLERLQLYLQFDRPLTPDELEAYRPLLLRRARREPLQYVLGHAAFRELELKIDRRALIPRPETEVLCQAVLEFAHEAGAREWSGLDVGTGSGAVALSLLSEGPFRRVVATDASEEALELARENARELGLEGGLELRCGSLFEPVKAGERFDVVVSNPPYVARTDAGALEPEVREWEPEAALFAGDDGLDVIRALVRGAPAALRSGGLLALELGEGQAGTVAEGVRETGAFQEPRIRRDLAGRDRILLAARR